MRPKRYSYTPADDDTDGIANDLTGAGPWTSGDLVAAGPDDGLAHTISLTSAANLSGITITVTGTDADGNAQSEAITGPNANTVEGTKFFTTITDVSASATLGANTLDIGWSDTMVGPTIPLNWRQESFAVSLAADITGTIDYTVQHCLDDIRSSYPSLLTWWDHSSMVGDTADSDGNYAFPVSATRLKVNSLTAGATINFHVIQGR